MSRPSPTDPSKPAPAVKSGLTGGPSRRAKTTYNQDQTPGDISSFNPRPMPAPGAHRPARYQRVVPSPHGRVDPPAGNAAPPHYDASPAYQPPGVSQGYGQGGYAPSAGYTGVSLATGQPTTFQPDPGFSGGPGVGAAQAPVQGPQASPLLLALIAAMRGGHAY